MQSRIAVYVIAVVVLIAGLAYGGWHFVRERESHSCAACQRPVHGSSRTVALVKGKKAGYCCLACALSEQKQTRSPIQVVSLTDYGRGTQIEPQRAYIVKGSDAHSCSHRTAPVGVDKHPMHAQFDRCSPSLLAFSSAGAAESFARQHGGRALPYSSVSAEFR